MKIKGESVMEILDFTNKHPQEAEEVKESLSMPQKIYLAAKDLRDEFKIVSLKSDKQLKSTTDLIKGHIEL
jgi:hypothetical protein